MSRPSHERCLYRAISRSRASSIVEMGIAMGARSTRMIDVALRCCGGREIRFTGIDLFEARSSQNPGMTLKRSYLTLKQPGVRIQLVPGEPFSALARVANSPSKTDLIVIAADQDRQSLARAWFYVPRMLHERSRIFVEQTTSRGNRAVFQELDHSTVSELAAASMPRHRAAA